MSSDYSAYNPPPAYDPYRRPPRKSGPWLWLGIGGVLVVLVCCGGGTGLMFFGLNVLAEQVADQVRDHPAVREHIGEIEEIKVDFTASTARDDADEMVYDVRGTKGSGTIIAKSVSNMNGEEEIISATLRTSNGETFTLVP